MEDPFFTITEEFTSEVPPDRTAIGQAVTLWLTKELNKLHK